MHRASLATIFAVCTLVHVSAQNWPSFRGADLAGLAPGSAMPPTSFDVPASRNVAWRTPVPGLAHSSPIVWGGRVYVTTAVATSGAPALKTGAAGIEPADDMVSHTWRLLAIDAKTGRVEWNRAVHTGVPRLKRHVKASHASATPATDGRVIVALLGSEGLFCFDMNGTLQWKQDLGVMDVGLVDDPTYQWGPASSPVIHGDLVIVQNDRHTNSFVAAYEVASGKRVWQTSRDELPSWATPLVHRRGGRAELITNSGRFIRGHDPQTGKELWRFGDSATQVKVPSPVAAGDLVIVTGGYPGNGRPIYAFRPGLSGTVEENAALAWKADRASPYTPTPLVYQGVLYVVSDNGILATYESGTGARLYRQRISEKAGSFSASPIGAADRIYLTSEDGDVFVVRAGRTFELLATNPLGEVAMATPAVAGNVLIVRTRGHLVGLAAGPVPGDNSQAPHPEQAVTELLNADRAFSDDGAQKPVIESIPRMFAADVIVPVPGNRFADGREQAIEALRASPENLTARATWSPIRGGISTDGQHGFTFGYMTLRRADGTAVPLKYLAYWIRQPAGWRVAAYKRRPRAAGDVPLQMMPASLPARIVPTTAPASTEVVESLKRAEAEFSATAQRIGIGDAFAQFGSDDAVNMGGPKDAAFVVGAAAIGRSVSAGSAPGTSPVSWSADRAIVSPRGDLGITFGMIRSNDKEKPVPGVPFFTIWRRADPSRPWRYIAE